VRVALVHKTFGRKGGTEGFLAGLVEGLASRGHSLVLFVARNESSREDTPTVGVKRLIGRRAGGFPTLALLLSSSLRIRYENFDQVVHLGRTGPRGIYRAGGGCHRALHELLLQRPQNWWRRLLLRYSLGHRIRLWHETRALRSPDTVFVVPSQQARSNLLSTYGSLADKVQVVHNGVDLSFFSPERRASLRSEAREHWGIEDGTTCFLFLGSDPWRKGLDRVLHAFAQFRAVSSTPARLLVLGCQSWGGWVHQLIAELKLGESVILGRREERPLRAYGAADVLILPTRQDPFANVTLEALACGLPVITSYRNGAVEAVQGCPALWLVEAEDVRGLVASMSEASQAAETPRIGRLARRAAEDCDREQSIAAWEELILRSTALKEQLHE
jgi:UDP-glucose:(heptosyl)LPS alpha-1,3-glucosyltransferase